MSWTRTRRISGLIMVVVATAAALVAVISSGAAGARTARQITTAPILTMAPGSFEVSLGTPPQWLPLSGRPETLTVIGGAAKVRRAAQQNVYIGFTPAGRACAPTPAGSSGSFLTVQGFYSTAHSARRHAGTFAPDGGAPAGTYLASIPGVVVHESGSARVCVWLSTTTGPSHTVIVRIGHRRHRKVIRAPRSLVSSTLLPLLNRTFAASVSNLTGASAGNGGYDMYAIDAGHAFRYSASTNQCNKVSNDGATSVGAGTPASESVAISSAPCSTDASTFMFHGADVSRSLAYLASDALMSPSRTLALGGCELDPLTGTSLAAAESYLQAVGCTLGKVFISPYRTSLSKGSVAWASVDGGVAELAPAHARVDLVLNGSAATQPAKKQKTAQHRSR